MGSEMCIRDSRTLELAQPPPSASQRAHGHPRGQTDKPAQARVDNSETSAQDSPGRRPKRPHTQSVERKRENPRAPPHRLPLPEKPTHKRTNRLASGETEKFATGNRKATPGCEFWLNKFYTFHTTLYLYKDLLVVSAQTTDAFFKRISVLHVVL